MIHPIPADIGRRVSYRPLGTERNEARWEYGTVAAYTEHAVMVRLDGDLTQQRLRALRYAELYWVEPYHHNERIE